ncbi:MAG: BspA family leucine-rich repeat surface protein, partial [Chitinophagaceae bacterium]
MKKIFILFFLMVAFKTGFSQAFITTWNTGTDSFIIIPGYGTNYNITWEQVGKPTHNGSLLGTNTTTVNFGDTGTYKVSISGGNPAFSRINFYKTYYNYNNNKLLTVQNWGNIIWSDMDSAFYDCEFLTSVPSTPPNLTLITSLSATFWSCLRFNSDISAWNITNIEDMSYLFYGTYTLYNQPIGNWNTANVTNMSCMFQHSNFNESIANWNTANVTNMSNMFYDARLFNQPIGNWNTSKVTTMSYMFGTALSFNQPIGNWNTANVTTMEGMFYGRSFSGNTVFNQPIGNWNTANVTNMERMFMYSPFNQPIGNWNTAKVTKMGGMFSYSFFNQNIGNWKINNIKNDNSIGLDFSKINTPNYDSILLGWSKQNVTPGVALTAQGLKYCSAGKYRDTLTLIKHWVILGDSIASTGSCILPIHLTSFTATTQQSKVLLQWETATEINNNCFTVQRGTNKDNWQDIAIIKGAGNSSAVKEYASTDNNPLQGISYYRIQQTDFNGS